MPGAAPRAWTNSRRSRAARCPRSLDAVLALWGAVFGRRPAVGRFRGSPGRAWCAVAALIATGGALALILAPPWTARLDWQPGLSHPTLARAERGLVHYSTLHVIGNAAGLVVVAAYGAMAAHSARLALAWIAAWPLTHLACSPSWRSRHYGGASGAVHAGSRSPRCTSRRRPALGRVVACGPSPRSCSSSRGASRCADSRASTSRSRRSLHASGAIAGIASLRGGAGRARVSSRVAGAPGEALREAAIVVAAQSGVGEAGLGAARGATPGSPAPRWRSPAQPELAAPVSSKPRPPSVA